MPLERIKQFSDSPRPSRLLAAYGVILAIAMPTRYVVTGHPIGNPFTAGYELILLEIPAISLAYGGRWLGRSRFDTTSRWRILDWTGWGTLAMTSLALGVILKELWSGTRISDLAFVILMSFATGAVIGALFGVKEQRTRRYANRVETQNDALAFLNRVLRHNVLNGMQVIRGYAQRLEEEVNREAREDIRHIHAQSERIVDLIGNVRELGQSLADEIEVHPVDAVDIVDREVQAARSTHPHASFSVDLPDELPVYADVGLSAVMENVLRNAVEHNDRRSPSVSIEATVDTETVTIRVGDDGPGIPDDRKATVFQRGDHGNSGLGLYLVNTLVTRFGGAVFIEDNHPRGAVVVIELLRAPTG